MRRDTTPSLWVPAWFAVAVLLAGYVVGPAVGWLLHRRNLIRCVPSESGRTVS